MTSNVRSAGARAACLCAVSLTLGAILYAAAPAAEDRHPVSGRVIAPVMSYEGAAWLERPEREFEEQPSKAIKALGIRPGQVVADVGAGSGYYTVRLAKQVGPNGRVYATDVQPEMVVLLHRRLEREQIENVELVQA